MSIFLKSASAACLALALSVSAANAAGMATAENGMTLYVFDKDTAGVSTCYDACAAMWPAYVGKADSKLAEGWTLVKRTDGKLQFAFNKKPVYFYAPDKAKGDKLGDGKGGIWHIIAE